MSLKVAVQMDPIERINIAAESTFRIMEEAQARGHRLFYYTPDRLALDDGRVTARGWPVEVRREKGQVFVGIDVIGDWLTEINLTSPTGLQELERFDGINATAKIWEAIERRRAA